MSNDQAQQEKKKGLSPLAWVAIGCAGIVVLVAAGLAVSGFFVYRMVEEVADEIDDNPVVATARLIAQKHMDSGDPLGWFEDLYSQAQEDPSIIPWAELEPNPNLVDWLNQSDSDHSGLALKIGNGLGDDAEELSRRGFKTTTFDISASAIAMVRCS